MRVTLAEAGGIGREALAWLRDAQPKTDPVAFYVADRAESPTGSDVVLAVADIRAGIMQLGVDAVVLDISVGARRWGVADEQAVAGIFLVPVVHPTAFCGPSIESGNGTDVAWSVVLTRDVTVGRGAIVNYPAAVSHDGAIGNFGFFGPGAALTRDPRLGATTPIVASAVVLPGESNGESTTIGAGAVVMREFVADVITVRNQARPGVPMDRDSR